MSSFRTPARLALIALASLAILVSAFYLPAIGGAAPADGLFDDIEVPGGDGERSGAEAGGEPAGEAVDGGDRIDLPFGFSVPSLFDLDGAELVDDDLWDRNGTGGDVDGDGGEFGDGVEIGGGGEFGDGVEAGAGDGADGSGSGASEDGSVGIDPGSAPSIDGDLGADLIASLFELFERGDGEGSEGEFDPEEAIGPGDEFVGDCRETGTGLLVCFEDDVVAGGTVALGVYHEEGPVEDATVLFDGERVGRTGADGRLDAEVPYTRELDVEVQAPADQSVGSVGAPGLHVQFSPANGAGIRGTVGPANESIRTAVEGDLTISADEETLDPGGDGEFTVTVGDRPVADARVTLDGEPAGTTDEDGTLAATLPVAHEVTVEAERGELTASETFALADLSIDVDGSGPFGVVLPGGSATVDVADGNETVAGATVSIDGTAVGSTDENGTVTTSMPTAWSADVAATTVAGVTRETTMYPYASLAALAVGVIAVAVGLAVLYRRSNASGRTVLATLREWTSALTNRLAASLVGLSARLEGIGRALARRVRAALSTLHTAPRAVPARVVAWLRRLWIGLRAALEGRIERGRRRLSSVRERAGDESATSSAPDAANPTDRNPVEAAWWRFLGVLGLRSVRTKTPGQVASRAIDAGHARGPVERLTDAFRAVSYSSDEPVSYAETATAAAEEIVAAADEAGENVDRADGGDDSEDSDETDDSFDGNEGAEARVNDDIGTTEPGEAGKS